MFLKIGYISIFIVINSICLYANQIFIDSRATIKPQILITELTKLNFGRIYIPSAKTDNSGTITLERNNLATSTTRSLISNSQTGRYIIKGLPNASVSILLNANTFLTNGIDSILAILKLLTEHSFELDATGSKLIEVGGQLFIPNALTPGQYNGEFTIIASY